MLRLALASIEKQSLRADQFEVIVVDNGSTDDTRAVVDSFKSSIGQLRYTFDPLPGLHVGRHRGLAEARGDFLVYADDDIQAVPSWLAAIRECFLDPAVALVGGNNYPQFEASPPDWLVRKWHRHNRHFGGRAITSLSILELPEGRRALSPYLVWGCNFSIRRQVLLDAGGFHPDGMPAEMIRFRGDGETHVSAHVSRCGLRCVFDSAASVHHTVTRERMTFDYFEKRAFSQGISDSFTALRFKGEAGVDVRANRSLLALGRDFARSLRARLDEFSLHSDLRTVAQLMREGYRRGFAFHQRAYLEDPQVRSWVHKPHYF
jgi:glycosyltransferase involved in cell wall biosynthesis